MENNNTGQRTVYNGQRNNHAAYSAQAKQGLGSPDPGPRKRLESFRELKIWQKGMLLVKAIYGVTRSFPQEERFGLTDQMRRAAVSIPSNIAEGFQRWHEKEFKQHLNIALGSLAELETQVLIACELNYLHKDAFQTLEETIAHTTKMTINMAKALQTRTGDRRPEAKNERLVRRTSSDIQEKERTPSPLRY